MAPPETVGAALLRLRQAAGMTRYRLAKSSGVNASHLMRLENDEQGPSLAVALKIARALGVSLAAFDGCGEVKP
jgi:transcriptional regulator with XRE-family HTH domain